MSIRSLCHFFILSALSCHLHSPAADWHQWRGPQNNGTSPSARPPLTWSETENVRWKVEIEGKGTSTPIVVGDRVYLTTAINTYEVDPSLPKPEDQPERVFGIKHPNTSYQMVVLCFDRMSGEQLWRSVATTLVPHEGHHKDASYASASPFCDGERLYCWFGSAGLYAYSLDGEKLWQRDLGQVRIGASLGEGSSPVVHDGKIVLVRDQDRSQSSIVVLNTADGKTLWEKDRDTKNSWATPAIAEHDGVSQVITAATMQVRSYDLATGEVIWWATGMSSNCTPSPIVDGDMVYCMSGYKGHALLAIPITGRGDVTDTIRWQADRGTPYVPSPILLDGQLYYTQSNQNILTSRLASDGSETISRTRIPDLGDIYASPVGADGKIYFLGRKGTTVVIEPGDELQVLATNQLNDRFHASPALAGKQLFMRGMRFLYCLEDGAELVRTSLLPEKPIASTPLTASQSDDKDKEIRQLLETIAKRDLPKDYHGSKHQAYVDAWFKTAGPKGAEVGRLWKEQRRLYPDMKNRGQSFIRILDYVRSQ